MGSSESKQAETDKLDRQRLKKTDTHSTTLGGTLLGKQTDRMPELHSKLPGSHALTIIEESPQAAALHDREKGVTPHLTKNSHSTVKSKVDLREKTAAKGPQTEYFKLKNEYDKQHNAYEKSLDQYWNSISDAANASPRRFITEFPPLYQGPPAPTLHTNLQQREAAAPTPAKQELPPQPKQPETLDKTKPATPVATTGDKLLPAAVELANLTGPRSASLMLAPANSELPTANFFGRNGYAQNPAAYERSSDELLMFIQLIMSGSCSDPAKHTGVAEFEQTFQSLNKPSS